MKTLVAALLIMTATTANAAELYDKQTGKYLGQLGGNPYAADSTNNPYGRYGSPQSSLGYWYWRREVDMLKQRRYVVLRGVDVHN